MSNRQFHRIGLLLLFFFNGLEPAWTQEGAYRLTLDDLLSVEPVVDTALSPDGSTVAMTRGGQIVLLPSTGGWPVTLTSTAGAKSGLSWSPDGRFLAYASQGSIWSVPVLGGAPKRLTRFTPAQGGDPRTGGDRNPQWSPKGSWILYETGRTGRESLSIVNADGTINEALAESNADAAAASWSPDGSRISYTERTPEYFSGKLNVINFDPKTGRSSNDPATLYTAPTDRGGGWSLRKAAWSPDGRWLAVVLQESGWDNLYLLPATGGSPKRLTQGAWEDSSPVFSPDGKYIAFISSRNNLEASALWIASVDGSSPH